MNGAKRRDPYVVLHWVLAAGTAACFVAVVVLIATWASNPSAVPQLAAAVLGTAGCVAGLAWVEKQRLNATLPDQWEKARATGRKNSNQAAEPVEDDDSDWEVGA